MKHDLSSMADPDTGLDAASRDAATRDAESGNSRNRQRHVVEVSGRYRSRVGGSKDIWIKDISETGCRFFDKFSILTDGSAISFRVGQIGPIGAVVRWRDKGVVGVQFDQPLHPSVLDHIVATMQREP